MVPNLDLPKYALTSRKISRAPLHEAYKSTANINKKRLEKLIKEGHQIVRGPFEKSEIKRLKRNWRRICRCYPEYSDPFYAFGITYRPKSCGPTGLRDDVSPRKIRRAYREFQVMLRMAYRLDNRLICDIYQKCRHLFCYSQFKYNEIALLSNQKRNKLYKQLAENDISKVCVAEDVSPDVAHIIKKRPRDARRMKWTEEDDFCLERAIERSRDDSAAATIVPMYEIDWKVVLREMNSCGYNLNSQQLYRRWYFLHPYQAGLRRSIWKRQHLNGETEENPSNIIENSSDETVVDSVLETEENFNAKAEGTLGQIEDKVSEIISSEVNSNASGDTEIYDQENIDQNSRP